MRHSSVFFTIFTTLKYYQMKKDFIKKYLPYLVALIVFIVLTIAYASPVLDGKVLQADDQIAAKGMNHECMEYNKTGHYSFWTGAMFSGMPSYQSGGGKYPAPAVQIPFGKLTRFGFTGVLALIIGYFIGFFILMKAFKIDTWLAIVGAIAMALSSYFFIIIAAGHNSKVIALGLLAPVIAGFYLIFQKKYAWGAALTMIYTMLAVLSHPQMTLYMFMLIGVMACAELYIHIKEKRWKDLLLGILIFGASFALGVGTQIAPFLANREYLGETMRGGHSELTKAEDSQNKTEGLDLDYATQWSYGIDETMTLLVPGSKGYASGYNVGTDSKLFKTLTSHGVSRRDATSFCAHVPGYWGEQPFTAGPVYVGAIVFFLFVLGLLIVKGPYKWALLVATLFSIMLAWGRHFMPLTELFFNYFPMYNKFRAVASILVVAEITMPLLGFLAIKTIMDKAISQEKLLKNIYIAAGITVGLCLVALVMSMTASYTCTGDEQMFAQYPDWIKDAVIAERASMFRTSVWRSLFFVIVGAGLVWLFAKEKLKFGYFVALLGCFILIDMWPIDRKFFNDDNFVAKKQLDKYFTPMPYEEELLADTDPNFRVLNLSVNTFNDSRTSYYFKSIGGYSAVKLRRYQDLIDAHIMPEINPLFGAISQTGGRLENCPADSLFPVLNMLNMKYVVVPMREGSPIPVPNPNAMGNAWFVEAVAVVNTPDEESEMLNKVNLRNTLVTSKDYEKYVQGFVAHHDTAASIKLTAYAPDYVEYHSTSSQDGIAVFSEIYYPYGWNAYIDGKPVDHFRANYTLRALNIPAGVHDIRFEFRPAIVEKAGRVSVICKYLLNLVIIGLVVLAIVDYRKKRKTAKA